MKWSKLSLLALLIFSTVSCVKTVQVPVLIEPPPCPSVWSGDPPQLTARQREGFVEMSKLRPIHTNPKLPGVEQFYPPYGKKHSMLFNLLLKFKK